MIFHAGDSIYKYQLLRNIGGGAFGEVWLAKDIAIESVCALKLLPKTDSTIAEKLLEAQIGNRLQHANVINIKYADVIQYGTPPLPVVAIAMPYYEQGAVTAHLNTNNFLDTKTAVKCLIDVLKGLEYLHENGYFHCDIKPNNILVGTHNDFILSDYGITCYSPDHEAVSPRQIYMPHISPEMIKSHQYDERSDIYQLGITAFRLFNGISELRNEFSVDQNHFCNLVESGRLITDGRFQPFIPRKIRRIINKATASNPELRYQTALEMRRALEQLKLMGSCSADENGNIIIYNHGYLYRYEIETNSNRTYNLIVYKMNEKTGRETHASKYCSSGLRSSEIKKNILSLATDLI